MLTNFERIKSDPLVGLAIQPYYPTEGAMEIIDEFTVQYNLLEPNALFPAGLTTQAGFVASPTWLDAAIEDPTLNQAPVGTGPFVFASRSPDSVTRMVRNEDWWNGSAYLDAIEFVPVPDHDTRNDLLFSGDLQGIQASNPASVGDLLDRSDEYQNIIDETGPEGFMMINSSVPPFDDIRARKALTFATPLQTFRDLIGLGVSRDADQMFTPESPNYNSDVTQEGDLPDEAIALAAEYCAERGTEENPITAGPTCSDGKINIELQWAGPSVIATRTAEILDEGWSSAFNVTFDELAQDASIQQTALGQFNVNTWRQFGEVDPISDKVYMMCRNIGGISLNWPKFCSEERDALLNELQTFPEAADRVEPWQSIVQDMHDTYTYIFTLHTIWDDAFDSSVRGVCERPTPDGGTALCVHRGRPWFDSVWLAE
jgi:ABC-type transport system substrate-binding protein